MPRKHGKAGRLRFFVSPDTHIDTRVRGRLTLPAGVARGLVGFVLGYRSPLARQRRDALDFVVLDWNGATRRPAELGWTLTRVKGVADPTRLLRKDEGSGVEVLGRRRGATEGWAPGRTYAFEIAYRKTRLRVSIDGTPVFDVTGGFPEGRIGFYTHGQPGVRFEGLTALAGNTAPVANAGPDQTLPAGAGCQAAVTLDASASQDPDGDVLAYTWTGPFGTAYGIKPTVEVPTGVNTITLTVDDGSGGRSEDTLDVIVRDVTPPALVCPAAQKVMTPAGVCQASPVSLAAPASSDNCGVTRETSDAAAVFPHGTTLVNWAASDAAGNLSSCAQAVTVDDATAPQVTATTAVTSLWPPDHAMVDVGLSAGASDTCGDASELAVAVSSDEPSDATGDGDTEPDARVDEGKVWLRSERKGNADGRVYLLLVTASDPAGNVGHACRTVVAPHSQSKEDVDAVNAQAQAARDACAASGAAPAGFFLLAQGPFSANNRAPVVSAGPDQTLTLPARSATLQGSATDDGLPAGSTLVTSWSLVSGPGPVTFADAASASTVATFEAAGTYLLRLTASDGALTASDDVTVTLVPQNQPPVVDAGPDQAITLPNSVTLTGSATDDGLPSGSTLSVSWTQLGGPGGVSFGSPASVVTSASFSQAGVYILRLTASDGELSASDDVSVTVIQPNQPPIVSAGPDRTVALRDNLLVNPSDEAPLAAGEIPGWTEVVGTSWTQAAAGTGAFPPSFEGGTYFFAGDVAEAELAQDVDVRAAVASGAQSFEFRSYVRASDEAFPGSSRLVVEYRDQANQTLLDAFDSGPISSVGGWTLVPDTRVAPAGTGFVRVRLLSTRRSASGTNGYFDALSLRALPGPSPVTLALAGTASDDGLPTGTLAVSWSQVSGPSPVVFQDPAQAATAASFSQVGTYLLRLSASDSALTASADTTITVVAPNEAPLVGAGQDQTLTLPSSTAMLAGTASDDGLPAGGALTTSWSVVSGPGPVTFTDTAAVSTDATFETAGIYVLRLTASDSELLASADVVVTLVPANEPPQVDAGPDQTIGPAGATTTLNGAASDDGWPLGSALAVSWSQVSGPSPASFLSPEEASTTASFPAAGVYLLRLTASDSALASTSDVTVTVLQSVANLAPIVSAGPNQALTLPTREATLGGTVTDDGRPSGSTLSVTWSAISGPGKVSFAEPNAPRSLASFSEPGSYLLRLTASDSLASGSDDVAVTLEAPPDLLVRGVDAGAVTLDGQTLQVSGTISAQIANVGVAPAGRAFSVVFFEDLDGNGTYDAGADNVLGSATSQDVPAGGSAALTATLAGTLLFRGNRIHALADSLGEVAESNETNNLGHSTPPCTTPAPGPFAGQLEWAWTAPAFGVQMAPAVMDLDGDGIPEIVFISGTTTGLLRAIHGNGGAEYFTVTNPAWGVSIGSQVALGDIDGDGKPEIVAVHSSSNRLIAFEHDGGFKWLSPIITARVGNFGGAALADLDGDGVPEIVYGRNVLSVDGTLRWTGVTPGVSGEGTNGGGGPLSLVADLDMDGKPEVVAGNTAYRADGSLYWKTALNDGYDAVANFDSDPFPELVLVSGGKVWLLEHTGAIKWGPVSLPSGGNGGPPAVADLDGDGVPEIMTAGLSQITVLRANGTILWTSLTADFSSSRTGPVAFDFDGDGAAEVVYSDEQKLRVYRGRDGLVLFETPLGSGTQIENPTIADVDGDGQAEIVGFANSAPFNRNGIFVFGSAGAEWAAARPVSNEHTYHVTNVNLDGTIPAHEAPSWSTFNSYRQQRASTVCAFPKPELTASYVRTENGASGLALTARVGNGGEVRVARGAAVLAFYDGDPTLGGRLLGTLPTSQDLEPGRFEDVSLVVPYGTAALPLWLTVSRDTGTLLDAYDSRIYLTAEPNEPPVVDAGPDQTLAPATGDTTLAGTATDDGLPAALSFTWTQVSGPNPVVFASPSETVTTASFAGDGTYVLRLTASDSQLTASDDVVVTVGAGSDTNRPPVVSAGPNQALTLPTSTTTLTGSATDDGRPTGSALAFSWTQLAGPSRVVFGTPSRAVTTASFGRAGTYVLRLTASDSALTTNANVVVTVDTPGPTNQAPLVTAGADQVTTLPASTLTLAGTATDDGLPAGGTLTTTWSAISAPGSVSFADASQVASAATFGAAGTYVLRLTASDGEKAASDDVMVLVNPAVNQPPVVSAGTDQAITLPTNTVTLAGTATDDGLPAGSALSFSWSQVSGPEPAVFTTPAAPTTTATFPAAGVYRLRLTATDGALAGSSDIVVTVAAAPPVGDAPKVAIASPIEGSVVTTRVDVVGTVDSPALLGWKLEYKLKEDTAFTTFASGTTPVAGGVLATFDPTLLLNGIYDVRLTARDTANRASATSFSAVVKENQKVGNFSVSFTDMEVPVAGFPIRVTRTYDSRDKRPGDFGVGWRLDLANVRVSKNRTPGLDWQGSVSGIFFLQYCLAEAKPHVVTVTFADGKLFEFQPMMTPSCQSLGPISVGKVSFKAKAGTVGTLEALDSGDVTVVANWPGPAQLYGADFTPYNPTRFRYTATDGTVYVIDQRLGLQSATDLNGNVLTVTSNGVQHSSGQAVTFVRDGQGRITSITDPDGNALSYAYDASGDLASFKDRENNTTTFGYNQSHGLLTIHDPRGIQPIRNDYDASGRLVRHTDAFGRTIEYTHNLTARQEVVVDRNGNQRVLEYDARGNVVSETDTAGKTTRRTYDARNNRTSETDPLGKTTFYTFDASDNLLSVKDPVGNITEYTYNARKQVLTTTDARGKTTTNVYDVRGNHLSTTDPAGNVTTFTYDTKGNLATQTDPLGNVTRYTYDTGQNLVKETDPLGHETSYTYYGTGNLRTQTTTRTAPTGIETLTTTYLYDRDGRLLQTTDPDGTTSSTVYNSIGTPAETLDKLGRRTTYDYDLMGRLVRTSYPNGTSEESTYDAEGHRLTATDRGGQVTAYLYDLLGRLVKTSYANGYATTNAYDDAGRLVTTKDNATSTAYTYDYAGRRLSMRRTNLSNGESQLTTFAYDASGNQTSAKDPKGQTTTYEYDALNRRTKTIFPDATFTATAYDALGHKITETDPAGKTMRFEYDKLGRLSKVTDALSHETSYAYDEQGNRLSQTDANIHITRFEYDKLGRQNKRTLPLGTSETMAYDPAGNLITKTAFGGNITSYSYDLANRLTNRSHSDGSSESFTYTATGRRATATDPRGTTTYAYDTRDRLTTLTYPDGRSLSYTYDLQGNRKSLAAKIGTRTLTSTYTSDGLGQLKSVFDPLSRGYFLTYDPNGNRATLTYPNNTRTTYSYNTLNRLTNLTTIHISTSRMIQSYAFTLGPAGNRTQITENDGTVRSYAYDDLYRLTGETVNDTLGLVYSKTFAYDPVGNRLSQATTGAGAPGTPTAPGTINYGYDERDRLLLENGTSYAYDDNGNLVTKLGEASYTWDALDRLVRVQKTDGTVIAHAYDVDGTRVQTTTTPPGQTPQVVNYLVDTAGSLSHVVAETDGAGALKALYVRADNELLSVMRPTGPTTWSTRYVHADGLGSIRRLTDESANVTDGWSYTSFGETYGRTGTDPIPYEFAGEPYDPNVGWSYHRARWVDPRVGRFASEDQFEGLRSEPLSLHKYIYGHANPVNNSDPSGRSIVGAVIAGLSIGAILAGIAVIAWRPRRASAQQVSLSYKNSFTMKLADGTSDSLSGSEIDLLKVWLRTVFYQAFSGLAVSLVEGGAARHRVTVLDDCCGSDAGETLGSNSWVNYGGAASWGRSHGAGKSREEMVAAMGRALGAIVAHEVAHQFVSYAHDENDQGAYDYRYTYRSSTWFFGQLHWTATTETLLRRELSYW